MFGIWHGVGLVQRKCNSHSKAKLSCVPGGQTATWRITHLSVKFLIFMHYTAATATFLLGFLLGLTVNCPPSPSHMHTDLSKPAVHRWHTHHKRAVSMTLPYWPTYLLGSIHLLQLTSDAGDDIIPARRMVLTLGHQQINGLWYRNMENVKQQTKQGSVLHKGEKPAQV